MKKAHTAAFVLPEVDPAFHRRALAGAHNVPASLIERAWNEVRKLRANLNSGYYSHSSGESDMPPSDDEYTDEIYLRPRRHTALSLSNSPRSSATANSAKFKFNKRRECSEDIKIAINMCSCGSSSSNCWEHENLKPLIVEKKEGKGCKGIVCRILFPAHFSELPLA